MKESFNIFRYSFWYRSVTDTSAHKPALNTSLNKLESLLGGFGYNSDVETQTRIEKFLLDNYNSTLDKEGYFIKDIHSNVLGTRVAKYIMDREDQVNESIDNLLIHLKQDIRRRNNKSRLEIFGSIDKNHIKGFCYHIFFLVLSYSNTDIDKNVNLLKISVKTGKKIIRKYMINVMNNKYKDNNNRPSYSSFLETWISQNKDFHELMNDDGFCASLATKLIEILEDNDFLKKKLVKDSIQEHHYDLVVSDEKLIYKINKRELFSFPEKLPMVVKPNIYSHTEYGGYKLNDVYLKQDLFINKKAYKIQSKIYPLNCVYEMVNKTGATAFKINSELLDMITQDNRYNLLYNPYEKHEYAGLDKRTKYQDKILKSYNSKVVLQETVLEIAFFYRKFSNIYFPMRLDQRGRVYCEPSYFNYQSNELSRSLLLFHKPGIIHRKDMSSITYLKAYGANCYGSYGLSKKSISSKETWVDNHINDILNYKSGKLLAKAKDKLLFLAFCLEFTRFWEFYTDESKSKFETYLPIQLDATCNGFQHMALLSNESTLFKELNLIQSKDDADPKDFYNFLLHRLISKFDEMLNKKDDLDSSTSASYERLSVFIWDRAYIKKAIMTTPYNVSLRAMNRYITDNFEFVHKDPSDKTTWYKAANTNNKQMINNNDISLLTSHLRDIIFKDFEKIKKLTKYLKNIATLFNRIGLAISWNLPSGLEVTQSYLSTSTTSITPFIHSKIRLNLKVTSEDKYDKNKQTIALMPNLIHSLDASSLCSLYDTFSKQFPDPQFFSIHDCFATTCDKVFVLKTMLASVYTDLYSNTHYLEKFDKDLFVYLKNNTNYKIDNRDIYLSDTLVYTIHDIDWVLNKKNLTKRQLTKIANQNILI